MTASAFDEFAAKKTREALAARLESLSPVFDRPGTAPRVAVGNAWTRQHYGGDFDLVAPPAGETALSLVFVQSSDGNTGAEDPSTLGGGPTDKHLIYEGLSRVAADGVLAGATTVRGNTFFSVWHPELVALRGILGLPRHPAQMVISKRGRLDFDALLFNVPDVPVFLIARDEGLAERTAWLRARPWIQHIPLIDDNLAAALDRLRADHGIQRISAVGGRNTASRLVDAGVVQDLYLTTAARPGGEAGTPWYLGATAPALDVITRKQWMDAGSPVVFEHLLIASSR